jgi:hypothetical protein
MSDTTLILASCTERKRLTVPAALRLSGIRGRDVRERAARWWQRLMNDRSETLAATDLYAGGHWSVVRRLPDIARAQGLRPTLWVISAGYGLVPVSASLHAYSATFAPGHQDSVSRDGSAVGDRQTWWAELARLKGPDRKAPRSIAALVGQDPSCSVLVVASGHYVDAVEADLVKAADRLVERKRLIIITTPGRMARGPLGPHVIAAPARWQPILGGARTSLHARLAANILDEAAHGLSVETVRARLERVLERSPAVPKDGRQKMTDDDVRVFIRQGLARDPRAGHSKLLRALRDGGRACEQSRFRRLFFEVTGRQHGN